MKKFLIFLLVFSSLTFGKTVKDLTPEELREFFWDCDYVYSVAPELFTPQDKLICVNVFEFLVITQFKDNPQEFIDWRNKNATFQHYIRKYPSKSL